MPSVDAGVRQRRLAIFALKQDLPYFRGWLSLTNFCYPRFTDGGCRAMFRGIQEILKNETNRTSIKETPIQSVR